MRNNTIFEDFLKDIQSFDCQLIKDNSFIDRIILTLSTSPKNSKNLFLQQYNVTHFDIIKFLFEKLPSCYFDYFINKLNNNFSLQAFIYQEVYIYLKDWNNKHNIPIINVCLFNSAFRQYLLDDAIHYAQYIILNNQDSFLFNIIKDYLNHKQLTIYNVNILYTIILKFFNCNSNIYSLNPKFYSLNFYFIKKLEFFIKRENKRQIENSKYLKNYYDNFISETIEHIKKDKNLILNFIEHNKSSEIDINYSFFLDIIDLIKYNLNPTKLNNIMRNHLFNKEVNNTIYLYKKVLETNIKRNIEQISYDISNIYDQQTQELINYSINLENF